MKRKVITIIIVFLIFRIGTQLERYTLTVTATNETIQAHDVKGEEITLIPCRTEDGKRTILLESVEPGLTYKVTIDTNETVNTEDDIIVSVKKIER